MNAPQRPLPQQEGGWFLTDGGIETTLIFDEGIALPEFAAFVLLDDPAGRDTLARYYRRYLDIAAAAPGAGFILESPTWRANGEWGAKVGYDAAALRRVNADAIFFMTALRAEYAKRIAGPIVVSDCHGPRGDGYVAGQPMSGGDAMRYHAPQATALAAAGADMLTAITMTTTGEAIGVARAAAAVNLPCAISFTVETDGRLPSGGDLARRDRTHRRGKRRRAGLLHGELCAPNALRSGARCRAGMDAAHRRPARQCIAQESRRAGRGHRTRRGRSAGSGRALSTVAETAAAAQRAGRLLRHRPSPRRRHLCGVAGLTPPLTARLRGATSVF